MVAPVEEAAVAECEVEYDDVTSSQIDVAFEMVEAPNAAELFGALAVIWTTTPWTIPANQGIAYGEDSDYVAIQVAAAVSEGPVASPWPDRKSTRLNSSH